MIPPNDRKKLRPVGEFNDSKIIISGNHVEHWLNGEKIVEYELGSTVWFRNIRIHELPDNAPAGK